eukprot:Phypoly_transcript_02921.p1 GENE.Phypoly_transcript_02921~~Phypoly_transcript_02921.p1  ORF type:complete len:622 (+),score=127.86 Phypoly_transcript_02921:3-1868(+)
MTRSVAEQLARSIRGAGIGDLPGLENNFYEHLEANCKTRNASVLLQDLVGNGLVELWRDAVRYPSVQESVPTPPVSSPPRKEKRHEELLGESYDTELPTKRAKVEIMSNYDYDFETTTTDSSGYYAGDGNEEQDNQMDGNEEQDNQMEGQSSVMEGEATEQVKPEEDDQAEGGQRDETEGGEGNQPEGEKDAHAEGEGHQEERGNEGSTEGDQGTAGDNDKQSISEEKEGSEKNESAGKGTFEEDEDEELGQFSEYTFRDMEFTEKLVNELQSKGMEKCTHIQAKMIPQIMYGRNVLCVAPVGSGKTTGYLLTLMQRIDPKFQHTQLVINTATHAIAARITSSILSVFCPVMDISYCFVEDGAVEPKKSRSQIIIGSTASLHDPLTKKRLELGDVKMVAFQGAEILFSDDACVATCENYRDCPKTTQVVCVCNEFPKIEVERHLKSFSATYLSSDFFRATIPNYPGHFPRVRNHLWMYAKPGTQVDELFRLLREEPAVVGRKAILVSIKLHDCKQALEELTKKGHSCLMATGQLHKTKSFQILQQFRESQEHKVLIIQGRVDMEKTTTQVCINYLAQPQPDKYESRAMIVGDKSSTGIIANIVQWKDKDVMADVIRKRYNI